MTQKATAKISLEPIQNILRTVLVLAMIGSMVAMVFGIHAYQDTKFNANLHTHYKQAFQAATPREFANALWSLDSALDEFGMVQGDTSGWVYRPQNDMAFKRVRFRELAERADALASPIANPAEVGANLTDMRQILVNVGLPAYSFWMWSQGGVWVSVYMPLIIFGSAFVLLVSVNSLPEKVRNPFAASPQSA